LSTRIERSFIFQAGVHFEGSFIMNVYDIALSMEVETASIREQNIAMDRIKYFLQECLANSVFVHDTEKKVAEKYTQAGIKVCTLPEEPYDQIICLLLLLKLNSITEGRLSITDISLVSELSDDVKFNYSIEETESQPYGTEGWWAEPSTTISDSPKVNKKDKIVKLVKHSDWSIVDLDWKEKPNKSTEIIFTSELDK
jgi:hypothetical protein